MGQPLEIQVGVYPHRVVDGQVVTWNSVIRRRAQGSQRWNVTVLPPFDSAELAHQNALNWARTNLQ